MAGTNQLAEAGVGYDLATQQQLSTEERIQRGASGVASVAGNVAGGLGMAAKGNAALSRMAGKTATAEAVGADAAGETATVRAARAGPCFAAGTPLLTPDGARFIEDFRAGDRLLSRSEDDPEGPVSARRVLRVFQTYGILLDLHVGGRVIRTTAEHPFWVVGRGWTAAQQIEPGDPLLGARGEETPVERVDGPKESAAVYNLEIDEYHTYLVGSTLWGFSVWSHNTEGCAAPTGAAEAGAAEAPASNSGPKALTDQSGRILDPGRMLPAPKGLPVPEASELSNLGSVADRGGLTKAGRSLTKHASGKRGGSTAFPDPKGNPAQINQQAQTALENILNDPAKVVKQRPGRPGEQLLQINRQDGSGVIFKWNGTQWEFSHFAENLF